MAYFTTQLCTKILRPPLAWSPPIPIEIDSDLGTLVGATPFGLATKYALGTDDLRNVLKRNYEPQELSWKLEGFVRPELRVVGYQTTPGEYPPPNPNEPIFSPPLIFPFEMEVDFTGSLAAHEMPDFSRETRIVASMEFDRDYAVEGVYPTGRDSEGALHGGYLIVRTLINITFHPYSWAHDGSYYLEQSVTVDFGLSLHNGPSRLFTELEFDESVEADIAAGASSIFQITPRIGAGRLNVRDHVNGDNWGHVDLWRSPEEELSTIVALDFINLRHYLPITGF